MEKINRRRFLINSSLVTGGTVLGLDYLQSGPIRFGKEKVRIGVIGTGSRGQGLSGLIRNIEGLEVTACSDVIPFRLEQGLETAASGARGYADYRALLDDPDVDAVIISTPFSMHDEMAIAALDAGKHVYCEKTMAKGLKGIQAVLSKAQAADLVFQTGHQYHSSPLYNKVHSIITEGHLGEITAFECQWNRNDDWRRPVKDPQLERLINWRMYREYSGGLVAELMSHQIDFVNWVLDSHPEKITGFGGIDYWHDGRETYDNARVLFRYPNGVNATFFCTTINGFKDYEVKVLGKKGTIILDYTRAVIYAEDRQDKELGVVDGVSGATIKAWEQGEGVRVDAPGNDPSIDALKQFYDSITQGARPLSDVHSGAKTAKCVQISLDALHQNEIKYWDDYPALH